jgi:hypothetical protein
MSFLGFNAHLPLALFVGVFLLGAATGGSVFALLRRTDGCEAEPKAHGGRLMPIAMSILPGASPAGCSG